MNKLILVCAAGSLFAVIVWSAVCRVIPVRLGTALLGTNWSGARALLLPTAIGVAAFGVAQAARSGLRALADARRSLRARAIGSPGFVIFGSAGAVIGQGEGAAWGLALGVCRIERPDVVRLPGVARRRGLSHGFPREHPPLKHDGAHCREKNPGIEEQRPFTQVAKVHRYCLLECQFIPAAYLRK